MEEISQKEGAAVRLPYDVIVVGAGAAGMMAAGTAARNGHRVLLLEKMEKSGRKVRITGKGRCNVTNARPPEEFAGQVRTNAEFFSTAFAEFNNKATIRFFERLGVKLDVERGERVFPRSGKAWDIANALLEYCVDNGVKIVYDTRVTEIMTLNGRVFGVRYRNKRGFERKEECPRVIVATGGVSYPATGYVFAADTGHAVEPVRPSLTPLVSSCPWIKNMNGLLLRNVRATLCIDGEAVREEFGELGFSERGIEGAVALRMSRDAVDALIDNGRRGRAVTGANNRALKSLSDMLKGKQGRFRQNLLGKRVDYSGRSVIVVGPELKMDQCGLPKEMALELFKPFVMKDLVEKGVANNIKSARKMVERAKPEVWDSLETVIKGHPVLLNRAPTLHRLGIQAFEPVLVEGHAIKLHPLVCTPFNADFDGDQMAVHLPISAEAQAEARFLMLAANNLLKPSDGRPVAVPTQDMILGSYYLTLKKDGEPGEGKVFRDVNEALMAYDQHIVSLHAAIKVRITKQIGDKQVSKVIDATVGRLIFNSIIPQNLGFVDRTNSEKQFDLEISFLVKKKQLSDIIDKCIQKHGTTTTSEVLDNIKSLGYKYSTKSAITVAVCDASIPEAKKDILAKADGLVDKIDKQYKRGYISREEKSKKFIEIWNNATDEVTEALKANLDPYNPINMMADSGARGSINQIRQLAGMRGLIANTSGSTIEMPIRANYREGLNILEYFISSRGARKGLADTALRTADSGYLTRRLVDVSHNVIVREEDCFAERGMAIDGMILETIGDGDRPLEPLGDRILGRFTAAEVRDPETNELIVGKNEMITFDIRDRIVKAGITGVKCRTVFTCRSEHGVCAKCYGRNCATGQPVTIGEAVGIIAAQAIGEPGTQLTMRTFHTGGVATADDITQGLPRVEELFESRRPKSMAIMSEISGVVSQDDTKKNVVIKVTGKDENGAEVVKSYSIPFTQHSRVMPGDRVEKGDIITREGVLYPQDILAIKGLEDVQNYLINEVQKVYRLQGVEINDKHIEVIVRQMCRKVRVTDSGSSNLIGGALASRLEVENINADLQKRIDAGEEGLKLVEYQQVLLGITKAALANDSFLSAASFQETTRVLTEAAIKGKVDPLAGLKENVIIGKLIPAGTGLPEVREDLKNREAERDAEIAAELAASAQ